MANPVAPQKIAVSPYDSYDFGGGLPVITRQGVLVSQQSQIDSLITAAAMVNVSLIFSSAAGATSGVSNMQLSGTPADGSIAVWSASAGAWIPGSGSGAPSYAGARTKAFSAATSTYNHRGRLLNARSKLGLATAGTGIFKIGVVGDSTEIGYGIEPKFSWPAVLQQKALPALGYPSAGESAWCQYPGSSIVNDSRMTFSGTPTGGNGLSVSYSAAGYTQFVSTVAGTIAEVQILVGGAATISLTVDGAAPANGNVTVTSGGTGVTYAGGVITSTTATFAHCILTIVGLANTTHTVKMAWASGTVTFERFAVRGASGVMVENMGVSGSRTVDWIGSPNFRDTYYTPANFGQAPLFDLLIVCLGANDANGASGTYSPTSLSTFKSNLGTIVSGSSGGGPTTADKLLIAEWYNSANPTQATWETYLSAMYDVADTQNCQLIDLSSRYTNAPPASMFTDGTHQSVQGAAVTAFDIARAIIAA